MNTIFLCTVYDGSDFDYEVAVRAFVDTIAATIWGERRSEERREKMIERGDGEFTRSVHYSIRAIYLEERRVSVAAFEPCRSCPWPSYCVGRGSCESEC